MRALRVLIAGLLAVGGCRSSQTEQAPLPELPVTLRVDNRAFYDMNVFVVFHGSRVRVGLATGNKATSFRLPVRISGSEPLQFIADPVGGNRLPTSDEITVQPGDTVTIVIPPGS